MTQGLSPRLAKGILHNFVIQRRWLDYIIQTGINQVQYSRMDQRSKKTSKIREQIRQRQHNSYFHRIRQHFHQQIMRYEEERSGNDIQNDNNAHNREIRAIRTPNREYEEVRNGQQSYGQKEINRLLDGYCAGEGQTVSSQIVVKILNLIQKLQTGCLLTAKSMDKLLNQAQNDLARLKSTLTSKTEFKRSCERLGQILWIFLNESHDGQNIILTRSKQVIALCISIIKWIHAKHDEIKDMVNHLPGLSVVLLGNLFTNEANVNFAIQQIKLSSLLEALDLIIESRNCEDKTFMISNMLFQYPLIDRSKRKNMEWEPCEGLSLAAKEKELELFQVQNYIYKRLYQDQLVHLYFEGTIENSYQSPTRKGTPKKKNQNMQKIHQHYKAQIQKLKAVGAFDSCLSINYSNDLMTSSQTVKQLIEDLRKHYAHHKIDKNYKEIQQLSMACQRLQQQNGGIQKETVLLTINLVLLIDESKKHMDEDSLFQLCNMLKYIKNVFVTYNFQSVGTTNIFQAEIMELKTKELLELIHHKILDYKQRDQIMMTKNDAIDELTDNINIFLWDIYNEILIYVSQQEHQASYGEIYSSELGWLEMRLCMDQKKGQKWASSQEVKGIQMLAKYCDFVTVNYHKRRSDAFDFEESSQQSYINVEIDLKKIENTLEILKCKLREHKGEVAMVLTIVRSILTLIQKFKSHLNQEQNHGEKQMEARKNLLGEQLYHMLTVQLSTEYGNKKGDTLSQQICESIGIITGESPEMEVQNEILQEEEQGQMKDQNEGL